MSKRFATDESGGPASLVPSASRLGSVSRPGITIATSPNPVFRIFNQGGTQQSSGQTTPLEGRAMSPRGMRPQGPSVSSAPMTGGTSPQGSTVPMTIEERISKIERSQGKLVHATVDAMKQHQNILEIAEERWVQKVEGLEETLKHEVRCWERKVGALEEALKDEDGWRQRVGACEEELKLQRRAQDVSNQDEDGWRRKICSLEEELRLQRRAQDASNQDVQALKAIHAATNQDVHTLMGMQDATHQDVHTLKVLFAAQKELGRPEPDGASNPMLVQAVSSVVEENESLRLALSELVEEMNRHQSSNARVTKDLEDVRGGHTKIVKVSHVIAEEVNRLRLQQKDDYGETTTRLGNIETLLGAEAATNTSDRKPERNRDLDDTTFSAHMFSMISQMQLQEPGRASEAETPKSHGDQSQDAPDQVRANGTPTEGNKGDVGTVIKLLRARLVPGVETRLSNAVPGNSPLATNRTLARAS